MAGGMTVEEALAFLNAKRIQEEEERTRKEIEEAEMIFEEAKLKGDPVMAMEDGGKLIIDQGETQRNFPNRGRRDRDKRRAPHGSGGQVYKVKVFQLE